MERQPLEKDHSSKNREVSLSYFDKIRNANWWIQVQFFVLIISIIVNIFLWVRNENLKTKIQIATYNDLAWSAIDNFTKNNDALNQKALQKIEKLVVELSYSEDWKKAVETEHTKWIENNTVIITELASKIKNYEAVVKKPLEPFLASEKRVLSIQSPFRVILDTLAARIQERKLLLKEIMRENLDVTKGRGPGYIMYGIHKTEKTYKSLETDFSTGGNLLKKVWRNVRH
jgi:hypothetical protein